MCSNKIKLSDNCMEIENNIEDLKTYDDIYKII